MNQTIKHFVITSFVLVFASCNTKNHEVDRQEFIYKKAIVLEDYSTAIDIVYTQMYEDSNNVHLYDSLAHLYWKSKNYNSCSKSLEHLLSYEVTEVTLKLAVDCSLKENKFENAIPYLKALSSNYDDSIYWKYQLGILLFDLGRYQESMISLEEIIANSDSKVKYVDVFYNEKNNMVPIYSAASNALGVILERNNYTNEAIKLFEESIRFSPDYIIAKNNLFKIK